jgi:Putative zinc-finger
MDKNSDREASVDRLLAGTLKARAEAVPDAACLDAETLAAWADGALDARERASAEAHAADCGRCQALLAAMVRTSPPPAAAAAPFRLRLLWWLAPIVPVAAALVIWFAVPNREPRQQSDAGVSAVDQAAPAPQAVVPADATDKVQAKGQSEARPEAQPETQLRGRVANERNTAPAPTQPPADLRARKEEAPLEKRAVLAAPASADALSNAAAGAPAAPPASPPPALAEAGPRRDAAASSRAFNFATTPETIIVSSNPSTRFRLLRGGGVQRSADAGATWQTEVTGATDTLTAGSSPSPSVCWLIGPSGTVLLSADGRSWRRRPFPETVDLRSITASDADSATVTTADGRAFVTTDGGQTWSRSL